jgi:hypothetical protein
MLDCRGNQENAAVLGARGAVRRPRGGPHIVAGEQYCSAGNEVALHDVAFLGLRVRMLGRFDPRCDANQTGLEIPSEIAEQNAPLDAGNAILFPVAELGASDKDLGGETRFLSGSILRDSYFRRLPGNAIEQRLFYRRVGRDLGRTPVELADDRVVRLDFRREESIARGETRLERGDFVRGQCSRNQQRCLLEGIEWGLVDIHCEVIGSVVSQAIT